MSNDQDMEALRNDRDRAQSMCSAWQGVFGTIEAHLLDRIAMKDEADPATYLSIIRSSIADVGHESSAITNARWADTRRWADRRRYDQAIISDLLAALQDVIPILECLDTVQHLTPGFPALEAARAAIAKATP